MAHPSRTLLTRLTAASTLVAAALAGPAAQAQGAYPNRAITVVAPYSAGGDANTQVVAAPPDGYTLLLARTGSQAILPAIQPMSTKYRWDDYTFIGMLELNPYGCAVNAKSAYRTLDDLVTAMRSKGKSMNFGTAGQLTTNDMGPRELFRLLKLGPDQAPTMIPYKGTGDAVQSLLAGETDFSCGSMGPFLAHLKAGTLRALMVTTAERLASLPDVPTARELGHAEMERIVGWSAVFGPAKLPADVRDKLTATLKALATDPAWLAGTAQTGSVPFIKSPEETREFVQGQYQLYRTLGEQLGIIDGKP